MKTFGIITGLLILVLSQQVVHAQKLQVKEESAEDFVKLEMPLEEALTKITFVVTWLSGEGSDEVIFEGESVIRTPDYIELPSDNNKDGRTDSYYRILSKYAGQLPKPKDLGLLRASNNISCVASCKPASRASFLFLAS